MKARKLTEISFSKLSFTSLHSFKIPGCTIICLHLVLSKHLGYSEFDAEGSGLQQLDSDVAVSQQIVFVIYWSVPSSLQWAMSIYDKGVLKMRGEVIQQCHPRCLCCLV